MAEHDEALTKSQNQRSIGETTKETQDIAPVFVDTKTANILHDMGAQTISQLK